MVGIRERTAFGNAVRPPLDSLRRKSNKKWRASSFVSNELRALASGIHMANRSAFGSHGCASSLDHRRAGCITRERTTTTHTQSDPTKPTHNYCSLGQYPAQQQSCLRPKISHRMCSMSAVQFRQTFFFLITMILFVLLGSGLGNPQDAEHLTAMVGDSIVFNCHVEFPEAHPVPYVIQWEKRGVEIPIFIWYENYLHTGEGYEGRVSRVSQQGSSSSHYGLASLNLTRIRESDQGWYSCLVNFLNRSPRQDKNGTLFHLNVHAPPRFTMTSDDVVYVSLGDPIILSCLAEGTPTPEILWYRENELVHTSPLLAVVNDGTELRISSIRQEDVGDFTCTAKNGQGIVRHTTKLVVAGGAVIVVPPLNVTRLEGDKLEMPCEARGLPGNFSVVWYRENHAVRSIPWLESRTLLKRDGTLVISPVHSDDRGLYTCEVTNGIGEPQRASAFLEVEYPARVTFTPTVQYLPLKLSGIVRCHVEAHPSFQFITWTKDKRIFDPFETPNVGVLKNGSLLFEKVSQENQGRYTCTPYNVHGTAGSSAVMEVLVREPPVFLSRPKSVYQQKIDDDVQMICDAQGSPSPRVSWRRMDGRPLPRDRAKEESGVLTLSKLRRSDFGYYECHVSNEVATLVATTHLVVEGTTPHAPYNITTESTEFSVGLEWLPGYSGGSDYTQNYVIWYRQEGASQWIPVDVDPPSSTKTVIHNLQPGTSYEFQVIGKNVLGDGMFSNIVKERTKGQRPPDPPPPGPSRATTSPAPIDTAGPYPSAPENLTVTETSDGVILSWSIPRKGSVATAYFTVDYCYDDQWRRLSKTELKPHETSFRVTNLNAGKTYMFRVNAHTLTNQASSEKISFVLQRKIKDKAITAGVVGGILFLIVAIILAVCTVKCVNKRNKRRRREQEKAYSMVACQVSDARNGNQSAPAKALPPRKGWVGRLSALRKLERLESCASAADELLYLCFTHRTKKDFKIMSLVDKRSKVAQNLTEHNVVGRDDFADWLEYGASERKRMRPQLSTYFGGDQAVVESSSPSSFQTPARRTSIFERLNRPVYPLSSAHQHTATSPLFVESGVYRVGGDRLIWPRPKPILHTEISPIPPKEPRYDNETLSSSALTSGALVSFPYADSLLGLSGPISSYSTGRGYDRQEPRSSNLKLHSTRKHAESSPGQSSSRDGIFHASFASQVTYKDQTSSSQEEVAFYPSTIPYGRFVQELPALLPIHEENNRRPAESPTTTSTFQTVRAEIHSGDLPSCSVRRQDKPPPFRPPPSPRRSLRSPNEPQAYRVYYPATQRPLATSSPPHSRRPSVVPSSLHGDESLQQPKMMRSPLLIAVRSIPSRPQASAVSRGNTVEYSPQSQSSSSGFDSKNTSQQNHSSQSGFGFFQSPKDSDSVMQNVKFERAFSDPAYENWPLRFPATALSPILDASVDTHYEFDATLSLTETGLEPSSLGSQAHSARHSASENSVLAGPSRGRKPVLTHHGLPGNIDARVQAMKQEFQEYRKRRARDFLESAC